MFFLKKILKVFYLFLKCIKGVIWVKILKILFPFFNSKKVFSCPKIFFFIIFKFILPKNPKFFGFFKIFKIKLFYFSLLFFFPSILKIFLFEKGFLFKILKKIFLKFFKFLKIFFGLGKEIFTSFWGQNL
ncbi:MAG: hypothetical protein CM15mP106_6970 [Candidatus Neomarinimicrobiota bacterium]|nr:MAG: hypothetical protein CM15mP106_6970 [Candidatus Neomarinimicrobiota bacterium]